MAKTQNEDIFKAWAESQKHLWEKFTSVLPAGQPPPDMEAWRRTYLQNLSLWEATVKQTLTSEAALLEQWAKNFAQDKTTANPLGGLSRQVEGAMRHWLRSQAQIWDDCFALLRGGKAGRQPDAADSPDPEDAWEEPAAADATDIPAEPALAAAPAQSEPSFPKDDLQAINGIGPMLEKKLNAQGIVSYRQIAALSDEDIAHLESTVIRFAGRIRRDRWMEQAKARHRDKYNESL
jgi:predicted flap endonuclease-1-like 5' DNA nuclease